ncbi:ATP synthase subunit I [bacterium]|nr:MAG: ATP synthase subunit I [bacterium]
MKFAAVVNIAVLAVGTLVCWFINISVAFGFVVGYIIGVLNAVWLRRTAKKITSLPLAKVGRHVAFNYYLRFFITVASFAALIYLRLVNPWSTLTGLVASITTLIILTILSAREEALK